MAIPAAGRSLDREYVETLAEQSGGRAGLPTLVLVFGGSEGEGPQKALGYVLKVRTGGFMALFPRVEELAAFFEEGDNAAIYAVHAARVRVESARGRGLSELDVLLVDAPWGALESFRKSTAFRGTAAADLVRLSVEDGHCRPVRASADEAAQSWITQYMDEDTAGEYVTCDEEALDGYPLDQPAGNEASLLARIAQLEGQLARQPASGGQGSVAGAPLLGALGNTAAADSATLARLRSMAGAAPTRFAQHERSGPARASSGAEEAMFQEAELEATAAEEVDELAAVQAASFSDPIQRLILLQMQQMALMQKQLVARQPADAIHAALGGGSADAVSGSSSGVKGCLAREAFLKIAKNLHLMASTVENNAAQELGLTEEQRSPGLLRDYLEKRVPLQNFSLLTQVGYLMAAAYTRRAPAQRTASWRGLEHGGWSSWSRLRWTMGGRASPG